MKTVFVDIDTQLDFLFPVGALYVPGAENLVAPLRQLTEFAVRNRIPIVSTADAHTEDDAEFRSWKPHCVAGTAGQQKAAATLVNGRVTLGNEIPHEAPQIIVEKQQLDCFANPHLRPLFEVLAAERYVVYGVVTELCVRCAAFGLLETGARVELVTDAIQSLDAQAGTDTINRFRKQSGMVTTVSEVIA